MCNDARGIIAKPSVDNDASCIITYAYQPCLLHFTVSNQLIECKITRGVLHLRLNTRAMACLLILRLRLCDGISPGAHNGLPQREPVCPMQQQEIKS